MTTSGTEFDIQEKTDILIKSAFGFPSTNENKAWFLETAIPANNYVVGDDILIESIPSNTDICFNTIVDANDVGLTSSEFLDYNTTNLTTASIVKDSTGVLIRFKKLILEDITGGSLQSWYKINSNINQDQLIPSGTNLLQNSLQFNTNQIGADQPYLYSVFKTKDNTKLGFGAGGGNWFIDNKNGVLFFTDYPLVSSDINSTHPPALTITTYIGKKGLSNFAGGGGGGGVSAGVDGTLTVSGDLIVHKDLELNGGIFIQDDYLFDTSATRLYADARFDKLEVRQGLSVYGDISANSFSVVKNVTFSGDITSDTLNTANIIQFDQTGTTLNIDLSGDVYRNSISTFGDINAGGDISANGDIRTNGTLSFENLTVNGDASFNGGMSVDGDVGIGTSNPGAKLHVKSGVFLAENTPNTNLTLIYPDGEGAGGNSNEYGIGNAKLGVGQFVNDTGTTGSTITLINKESAHNTTKHASIGFVNTDSIGWGKFGGQIGFWPQNLDATKQQFRIYTSGSSAGYNLPIQRMVVDGDGRVGIGTTSPQQMLTIYHATSPRLQILNSSGPAGMVFEQYNADSYLTNKESGNIYIRTQNDNIRMTVASSGAVGIGTTSPNHPLHIVGSGGSYQYEDLYAYHHAQDQWRYFGGSRWTGFGGNGYEIGLRVNEGIMCQRQYFNSDERIKKDIVDLVDDEALLKFRQLKPKTYSYRDTNRFGDQPVYGFIAQEVAAIIPNSHTLISEYIPSIMTQGKVSLIDASSCVLTIAAEHELVVNDIISCKDSYGMEIQDISVIEIIDSNTIKINKVFTEEETTFKDETGYNETDIIFVYGKKVDDFHSLNKDSIWTVATAALQEVDRQQQADKARIATLETEIETLKTQNAAILSRLSALESA